MKKYNSKLLLDYINGEDIDVEKVEELENNGEFMMDVINLTNDKKMYNLCGDSLKKDYEFIVFLVCKFKEDIKFIMKIADEFLNNNEMDLLDWRRVELNIILSKIIGNSNDEELMKYKIASNIIYSIALVEITIELKKDSDNEKKAYFGLGFNIIEGLFENSMISKKAYAKRLISDIFYGNEKYKFEPFIRSLVKNKEDINSQNVNNFILKTLDYYDANLSWFATCHIEILNNLKKELNRLYDNWDGLLRIENSNKVDIFEEKLIKYFDDNEPNTPVFSWNELEDYIIKKFKLEDIFECNAIYESYYCENDGKGLLEMKISDDDLNFLDRKFIMYAEELATTIFIKKEKYVEEDCYSIKENINKEKSRILRIDFSKVTKE